MPEVDLTPREKDIVREVARGSTCPEIADRLGLSPHTVRTYVQNVAKKLPGRGQPMQKIMRYGTRVDAVEAAD